ncbi:hypothetical protein F4808DRAFT_462235 [Astrocystis sublimbata]|nr:hypothetical protein F4808DRAFT_462235 [Astrocystis sublimbata]
MATTQGTRNDILGVHLSPFSVWAPWELQQIDHVDKFVKLLVENDYMASKGTAEEIDLYDYAELYSHTDCLLYHLKSTQQDERLARIDSFHRDQNAYRLLSQFDRMIKQHTPFCFCPEWQIAQCLTLEDPIGDHQITIEFRGDNIDLPPFGWVDATQGFFVQWFGDALNMRKEYVRTSRSLQSHRWSSFAGAGFATWCRSRIEALKKAGKHRYPGRLVFWADLSSPLDMVE